MSPTSLRHARGWCCIGKPSRATRPRCSRAGSQPDGRAQRVDAGLPAPAPVASCKQRAGKRPELPSSPRAARYFRSAGRVGWRVAARGVYAPCAAVAFRKPGCTETEYGDGDCPHRASLRRGNAYRRGCVEVWPATAGSGLECRYNDMGLFGRPARPRCHWTIRDHSPCRHSPLSCQRSTKPM